MDSQKPRVKLQQSDYRILWVGNTALWYLKNVGNQIVLVPFWRPLYFFVHVGQKKQTVYLPTLLIWWWVSDDRILGGLSNGRSKLTCSIDKLSLSLYALDVQYHTSTRLHQNLNLWRKKFQIQNVFLDTPWLFLIYTLMLSNCFIYAIYGSTLMYSIKVT